MRGSPCRLSCAATVTAPPGATSSDAESLPPPGGVTRRRADQAPSGARVAHRPSPPSPRPMRVAVPASSIPSRTPGSHAIEERTSETVCGRVHPPPAGRVAARTTARRSPRSDQATTASPRAFAATASGAIVNGRPAMTARGAVQAPPAGRSDS
jgi:hypothetical protein